MNLEGLRQVVVGGHGNVLLVHLLGRQATVGEQHELALAAPWVRLELIAELAARDALLQVLLTDNDIGIQRLDVRQGVFDIVVDMEVIDLAEVGVHEVQELMIVVDEHYAELLRLVAVLELQRLDSGRQCLAVGRRFHSEQGRIVEFQAVLGGRLRLLLRILQRALHFRNAGDDLQQLEVQ